jgi:hypothetical protein
MGASDCELEPDKFFSTCALGHPSAVATVEAWRLASTMPAGTDDQQATPLKRSGATAESAGNTTVAALVLIALLHRQSCHRVQLWWVLPVAVTTSLYMLRASQARRPQRGVDTS